MISHGPPDSAKRLQNGLMEGNGHFSEGFIYEGIGEGSGGSKRVNIDTKMPEEN